MSEQRFIVVLCRVEEWPEVWHFSDGPAAFDAVTRFLVAEDIDVATDTEAAVGEDPARMGEDGLLVFALFSGAQKAERIRRVTWRLGEFKG